MPPLSNPGNEFDTYHTSYSDAVNKSIAFSGLDVDFFTRAKAVRLVDWLRENIGNPKELSVLDVGCGVGNYHPLLVGDIGKLAGVDPSAECIEVATSRNLGVTYKSFDGRRIPFGDNTFDAAFAICVMHHVPPPQWNEFSTELARVVRPGGAVLIYEHNPYNPLTQRVVSNCPFDKNAVLLKKRQIESFMLDAGLSQVCGRYILAIPSISGMLRRVDDAFGVLPLGAQYYVAATKA